MDNDLHESVRNTLANSIISTSNRVLVKSGDDIEVSLSRDLLILFSPVIRDILSTIHCCTVPTIYLPDISTATIIMLRNNLHKSIFGNVLNVDVDVLEAASVLGIDLQKLHREGEEQNLVNNDDRGKRDVNPVSARTTDGGKRSYIIKPPSGKVATTNIPCINNSNAPSSSPALPGGKDVYSFLSNDQVIKEKYVPLKPIEQNLTKQPSSNHPAPTPIMTVNTDGANNHCQLKCNQNQKMQPNQLRVHYCQHFKSILKRNYARLIDGNKCLMPGCLKSFTSPGRLLIHIGVEHDKINDILRSHKIAPLPPISATHKIQASSTDDIKYSVESSVAPNLRDTNTLQLVSSQTEPVDTPTVENTSPNNTTATVQNTATDGIQNLNSSECNYDLECQVCHSMVKTLSLLEQHCSRHFLGELEEQFSPLFMDLDGLKCKICLQTFKQKQGLLLHIGCKHGKINKILKQKNFAVLPMPVTNASSAAMQKQLLQAKEERKKNNLGLESFDDIRNELMEEDTLSEASTNLLIDTSNDSNDQKSHSSSTLDSILKKYRSSQ